MRLNNHSLLRLFPTGAVLIGIMWLAWALQQSDPGRIVFSSSRSGPGGDSYSALEIFSMRADGSDLKQLTQFRKEPDEDYWLWLPARSPACSPDGKEIVFAAGHEDLQALYKMKANGEEVRRLADLDKGSIPFYVWSPDGKKIAFLYNDHASPGDIYVVSRNGENLKRLTFSRQAAFFSWSPDSQKIVFEVKDHSLYDIYLIDADGSNLKQLTQTSKINERGPRWWSPAGDKILFMVALSDSRQFNTYTMNMDGSNVEPLFRFADLNAYIPSWSPDGSKAAFLGIDRADVIEIYLVNKNDPIRIRLTNDGASKGSPQWSLDGSLILFLTNKDYGDLPNDETSWGTFPKDQIYVMNPDGTGQRNITQHPSWNGDAIWCVNQESHLLAPPLLVKTYWYMGIVSIVLGSVVLIAFQYHYSKQGLTRMKSINL